jgi:hypothetical protein
VEAVFPNRPAARGAIDQRSAVDGLPDDVLAILGRVIRTWLRFNFDVDEVDRARGGWKTSNRPRGAS